MNPKIFDAILRDVEQRAGMAAKTPSELKARILREIQERCKDEPVQVQMALTELHDWIRDHA